MSLIGISNKALVMHAGKMLVIQCHNPESGNYWGLPGGGQQCGETAAECAVRECREETGYLVEAVRFVAYYEEIYLHGTINQQSPGPGHKCYHVFLCRLLEKQAQPPSELDRAQTGASQWLTPTEVRQGPLLPQQLREHLPQLLNSPRALFLGSLRTSLRYPL